MDPVVVISIYPPRGDTAAVSGASHAVGGQGTAGTGAAPEMPPPPAVDSSAGTAAEDPPAPPAAPGPSELGEPSGQDVPPPPPDGD